MDPAQNKDDQNQTTGVPPVSPPSGPTEPLVPPVPTSAPVDLPSSLPDLPHDMPMSGGDMPPEVPDPTSPPPPGADMPPEQPAMTQTITPPAPSRSKAKIVGAILAILILVISIPAGIFLVQKSQEIREKAECDPTQCVGWEQVNGDCNSWEQVNGDCNSWSEGPCDENDPETGECTHHAQGPCNGWEQVNGDCNSWEQVNGDCIEYVQCPVPTDEPPACDEDIEYCDEEKGQLINKHGGSYNEDTKKCDYLFDPVGTCGEPQKEACTYNEVCPDEEGGGIRECHGSKTDDEACHYDPDFTDPDCSECEGDAVFSGSCSIGGTENGSFSYSCQINCTGTAASCNQKFNLSSSWFHCKTQGGAACGEFSGSDLDGSGTPSLSKPTITAKVGSTLLEDGIGSYSTYNCGRTQFDVAINNVTEVAGGVHDMGSDCSVTCSSQGFWCANNAAQCGAPHVRHPEFSCDQPATQVCCQLKDTGTTPTAQCTNVKVYDANNNILSANQLKAIKAGDSVKLAINGSASSGTIDKARFRINAGAWQEATAKNSAGEYFVNYTIPASLTNFQFEGMIHHQSLNDWF